MGGEVGVYDPLYNHSPKHVDVVGSFGRSGKPGEKREKKFAEGGNTAGRIRKIRRGNPP